MKISKPNVIVSKPDQHELPSKLGSPSSIRMKSKSISRKPKSAFFNNNIAEYKGGCEHVLDYIYGQGRQNQIAEATELYPTIITSENFEAHIEALQDLEVIFSTWGMPVLSSAQIACLPNLKWVFYAAGGTRYFRQAFLDNGVRVCSATKVNAIPVAEFCLAHILLGMKSYLRNSRKSVDPESAAQVNANPGPGNYDSTVALIGNGSVARKLQEMLEPFKLKIIVIEPTFEPNDRPLEKAFEDAFVISNHLPNLENNKGIIGAEHFKRMREGATFINTGRGPQVNHDELAQVFAERPDLSAILDVQHPEPPEAGSPLYILPNVHLSPHVAGATQNEVLRLSDCVIEDCRRWIAGQPIENEVKNWML